MHVGAAVAGALLGARAGRERESIPVPLSTVGGHKCGCDGYRLLLIIVVFSFLKFIFKKKIESTRGAPVCFKYGISVCDVPYGSIDAKKIVASL